MWGWIYTFEVASSVFWLINFLAICWDLLEVWASYPGIHLESTSIFRSVFVLTTRFLILAYQTLYLMWAFGAAKGSYLRIEASPTFWWCQYVWLSLLCVIPYFVGAIFNLCPSVTTTLMMSRNDYIQNIINVIVPMSRLYTGKEVHESFKHAIVYNIFWGTLIMWKLYFSYVFEVYTMALPSIQLLDDYINHPDQGFWRMFFLLVLRWLPQFIIYCIDMSIWYSVWQAFAGTSVASSEHLGNIHSIKEIRERFAEVPEHFCSKMLSPGSCCDSSAGMANMSQSDISLDEKQPSLISPNSKEGKSLLAEDPNKLQGAVNRLLDVRIQKWVKFSTVWNEIIDSLRSEDLVSNRERDYLKFSCFGGFSQTVYLVSIYLHL